MAALTILFWIVVIGVFIAYLIRQKRREKLAKEATSVLTRYNEQQVAQIIESAFHQGILSIGWKTATGPGKINKSHTNYGTNIFLNLIFLFTQGETVRSARPCHSTSRQSRTAWSASTCGRRSARRPASAAPWERSCGSSGRSARRSTNWTQRNSLSRCTARKRTSRWTSRLAPAASRRAARLPWPEFRTRSSSPAPQTAGTG